MSKTKVSRNLILSDFDLKVYLERKTDDLEWWSDQTYRVEVVLFQQKVIREHLALIGTYKVLKCFCDEDVNAKWGKNAPDSKKYP